MRSVQDYMHYISFSRTGILKTWFSSPSSNTIIHRVEQDLSNTENILFNTIAGENAGELRTTSGGNNSEMIMTLANFTVTTAPLRNGTMNIEILEMMQIAQHH